jgi:hypothetical protein
MEIGLGIFGTVVTKLVALGFYGFVLPWILAFAVTYAILLKTKILGDNGAVAGIVAFAVAFMVPLVRIAGVTMGGVFVSIFGFGALIIAILVLALMIFGMLGIKF